MTKLIHMTGDIFTSSAPVIGHGVNTKGLMGSGIALQFAARYPIMKTVYTWKCENNMLLPGGVFFWPVPEEGRMIANIASQLHPGANARYEYLAQAVQGTLRYMEAMGLKTLALPRIGSGIGGLQESEVEKILVSLAESSSVDIELWTYNGQ